MDTTLNDYMKLTPKQSLEESKTFIWKLKKSTEL